MKNYKIYVAGHNGMVGSAVLRNLRFNGYSNLVYKSSKDLDLSDEKETENFFRNEKPEVIVMAAAKVGGILANDTYPFEFLFNNMKIQNNLIKAALDHKVKKLIFLGSSCIYPKLSKQPIKEDYLLTGSLEPTNQWYAIAKISGVKLIEAIRKQFNKEFISLMPTNLYGPNDNFDLNSSHVLPALIRKIHEAKINNSPFVYLWGTGEPMREFLHVDDLAKAIVLSIENNLKYGLYNVGSGHEISIKSLSSKVKKIVGYSGLIKWDTSKPNGTPRKLIDSKKIINEGFKPEINLDEGIAMTYEWYINNLKKNK